MPDEKKYLIYSFIYHLAILSIFIISFEWHSSTPVIQNTDQQDVISAVVLGDDAKSKILPVDPPKPSPPVIKPPKPEPLPPPKAAPAPAKALPTEEDAIALSVEKKKQQIEKDKALAEKMRKQFLNKELLADVEQVAKKQKNLKQKQQKELQAQFQKTLKAQSEQTLRQQLLNETIKLRGTQSRQSQGEVNKYKALMMQAISEQWVIPSQSDPSRVTQLMIRLARNGNVIDVRITKGSGDAALDSSARAAVLKASPLPVPHDVNEFEAFRQFVLKAKPINVSE